MATGHGSVRYNTHLPPPSHTKLFLQVLIMLLLLLPTLIRGGGEITRNKIMDRPFMLKYGTVSQVLLQLVALIFAQHFHS